MTVLIKMKDGLKRDEENINGIKYVAGFVIFEKDYSSFSIPSENIKEIITQSRRRF